MERGGSTEVDCDNSNDGKAAPAAAGTLNTFNINHFVDTHFPQQQEINLLSGQSLGLRRQPTKYPHGLAVCVQTICDEDQPRQQHVTNYSRASTLRSSSWDGKEDMKCHLDENPVQSQQQRKYHIDRMYNSFDNLAELQARRYKYPLTGNYYLDPQETATKPAFLTLDYAKRICKWKYMRWPLIFAASVLVFFGLITYTIWLHDISVARERYMQQRKYNYGGDAREANGIVIATTVEVKTVRAPTTDRGQVLQESTILRALNSRSRYSPNQQKLTTVEYALSKGAEGWDKKRKDVIQDTHVHTEETTMATDAAAPDPAGAIRLTSGPQNSLHIPIEEDERILRLINGLFPDNDELSTTATAVNSVVKVSPTIPPVTHSNPTVPMTAANAKSMSLDNRCYSTSLTMCQDVLDYDLTYNVSMQLEQSDLNEYQALVNSNCSIRSVEFLCAVLEPECRPSHIGILPPCRRICKAILEACSENIANSDVLTATFDCDLYPDSNDPHHCEDPTRRKGYCYANEFECYDRSCIPNQWQCDNIKDCSAGEDEDNCLVCDETDEFRCRSNEKCVSDSARCDMKYDCFDGSDEDDCTESDSVLSIEGTLRFDEEDINAFPKVFSYASILSPNQTNDRLHTYLATTIDDQNPATLLQLHSGSNRTSGMSKEEVTNSVPVEGPRGFVNFRDSKEIMMTSDSENTFKISSTHENPSSKKYAASTTPLQPAASILIAVSTEPPEHDVVLAVCAVHELRCVSGKCITVDQLCDKKKDCPDGFDELMCVYKDRITTTVRSRGTTILPNPFNTPNNSSSANRFDKRTIRTTIKRKVKP